MYVRIAGVSQFTSAGILPFLTISKLTFHYWQGVKAKLRCILEIVLNSSGRKAATEFRRRVSLQAHGNMVTLYLEWLAYFPCNPRSKKEQEAPNEKWLVKRWRVPVASRCQYLQHRKMEWVGGGGGGWWWKQRLRSTAFGMAAMTAKGYMVRCALPFNVGNSGKHKLTRYAQW